MAGQAIREALQADMHMAGVSRQARKGRYSPPRYRSLNDMPVREDGRSAGSVRVGRRFSPRASFARKPTAPSIEQVRSRAAPNPSAGRRPRLGDDFIWIEAYYLGQVEKLNEVQTAIAIFDVRDKRLVTIESFGDSCLRQSCLSQGMALQCMALARAYVEQKQAA
ncbi:hypothetical protein X739_05915 [Mesorhizobium sp. LNHC220B00]|nr:hypothetical protein X741_33790 [Mesorhizobium sp. LNHC229A00]ESY88042.1 hypothetical protein X739_05915 [Mesorhizobium sp. LNHC220B00]